jgi:hypothetical protein
LSRLQHPDVALMAHAVSSHRAVTGSRYTQAKFRTGERVMNARPFYDGATLTVLRCALDDVLIDRRFLESSSVSALEIAEHILAQAARGERDLQRIKASALEYLANRRERTAA